VNSGLSAPHAAADEAGDVVLHSALGLFASLAPVLNRDGPSSVVCREYLRLVGMAAYEVQNVLTLFLTHASAPPLFLHFPVFAGRVAWAHALRRRLDDAVVPVR
jgi:hypothetical protein